MSRLKDYPCLYYISAKTERPEQARFFSSVATMFEIDVESAVRMSDFFSHTSSGEIFGEGAFTSEELLTHGGEYFMKERTRNDCSGRLRWAVSKKIGITENCCIVCPLSSKYVNANIEYERMALAAVLQRKSDLYSAGITADCFHSYLPLSCSDFAVGRYPAVPFYSMLYNHLQGSPVEVSETVLRHDIELLLSDYLRKMNYDVPADIVTHFAEVQIKLLQQTEYTTGLLPVVVVRLTGAYSYTPEKVVVPKKSTTKRATKSASIILEQQKQMFAQLESIVASSSQKAAEKMEVEMFSSAEPVPNFLSSSDSDVEGEETCKDDVCKSFVGEDRADGEPSFVGEDRADGEPSSEEDDSIMDDFFAEMDELLSEVDEIVVYSTDKAKELENNMSEDTKVSESVDDNICEADEEAENSEIMAVEDTEDVSVFNEEIAAMDVEEVSAMSEEPQATEPSPEPSSLVCVQISSLCVKESVELSEETEAYVSTSLNIRENSDMIPLLSGSGEATSCEEDENIIDGVAVDIVDVALDEDEKVLFSSFLRGKCEDMVSDSTGPVVPIIYEDVLRQYADIVMKQLNDEDMFKFKPLNLPAVSVAGVSHICSSCNRADSESFYTLFENTYNDLSPLQRVFFLQSTSGVVRHPKEKYAALSPCIGCALAKIPSGFCAYRSDAFVISPQFAAYIIDTSRNPIISTVSLVEELCGCEYVSIECAVMDGAKGFIIFAGGKFYFFNPACGLEKVFTPLLSQNKKVRLLSVNPIPVYALMREFGFVRTRIESVAVLHSVVHSLGNLAPVGIIFHGKMGRGICSDVSARMMPAYAVTYSELIKSIKGRDRAYYDECVRLECALGVNSDLSVVARNYGCNVIGGNALHYQLRFSDRDDITVPGTLYTIHAEVEDTIPDMEQKHFYEIVVGNLGASSSSVIATSRLLALTGYGITYYSYDSTEQFLDHVLATVRSVCRKFYDKNADVVVDRIVFH